MAIDARRRNALTASVKNTPVKVSTANAIGGIAWRADGASCSTSRTSGPGVDGLRGDRRTHDHGRRAAELFDVPTGLGGTGAVEDVAPRCAAVRRHRQPAAASARGAAREISRRSHLTADGDLPDHWRRYRLAGLAARPHPRRQLSNRIDDGPPRRDAREDDVVGGRS